RIQKFDANGQFITKWGTEGVGAGQMNSPGGVAVFDNKIYVLERGNRRVQVFEPVTSTAEQK
ncbi:MAG: hypothetical protein ACLGPL_10870, partial [Acidobacteriota bacterium]